MIDDEVYDYIDNVQPRKYTILFYEEPETARLIEYRFMKNGLNKGEHCIYMVQETQNLNVDFIEQEMMRNGINVPLFKEKNLLHLYEVVEAKPNHLEDAITISQKVFDKLLDLKQPLRGVQPPMIREYDADGMDTELQVENYLHGVLQGINCSWICHYYLEDIELHVGERWMNELLRHHHTAIYAPKLSNAIVINLS